MTERPNTADPRKHQSIWRRVKSEIATSPSSVASSVAVATALFTSGLLFVGDTVKEAAEQVLGPDSEVTLRSQRDAQLVRRIGQLQNDVTVIQRQQAALVNAHVSSTDAVQLSSINARLDTVERRLGALEQAILASPEKAIALPLIRRDIDNVRESQAQSVAAVKQSVDQVYDLTKWLLGALAVGVFSLAIANFFTKK